MIRKLLCWLGFHDFIDCCNDGKCSLNCGFINGDCYNCQYGHGHNIICRYCGKEKWMTDVDDYITTLRESQLKRTTVIEDVDKIISENKRLKHDVGNLGYKIKNQRKEIERQIAQNAKLKEEVSRVSYKVSEAYCFVEELKELLKDCKDEMNPYVEVIGGKKTFKNLIDKIDEVLK